MNRHILKAIGVAAAASLALAACGSGSGTGGKDAPAGGEETGPVTITMTWWGNDDRAQRYEQAIALFNKKYPDIKVQTSFADFPGYWTARATEAAGRALPDVMQNDLAYLREYSENNHLLDLSPYLDDDTIDLSGFDEDLVKSGELDGKQIAIPTSTNTLALFYNPDLLTSTGIAPPAEDYTWEDYTAFLSEVSAASKKTADGHPIYGGADPAGTFWFFLQWLVQEGKTPFKDDGSFGFDKGDLADFLATTGDLREAKADYPIKRATQLLPKGGFTVNEATAEISWDNFLAGYTADSGTENITMMPVPSGPDGKKMFFKPSMLLSAGANTKHPHAAATLINFLLTDPEVGAVFGTSKGVPAAKAQRDAMKLEAGSVDAKVVAYEESVADDVTEPVPVSIKGFGALETEYKRLAEELSYGRISADEFADQWFSSAEQAIQ